MLTRYQYQVQGGPKTVGCIGSITYERYFWRYFLRYFWYFYKTGTVQKQRYLMFQMQNTGTALKFAIPLCTAKGSPTCGCGRRPPMGAEGPQLAQRACPPRRGLEK